MTEATGSGVDWLTFGVPLVVFLAGCAGGFVNALLAGELKLPRHHPDENVYRPGWIGNVILGGIAALVFWALYGRFGNASIMGGGETTLPMNLTVAEFAGAILSGIGGGRLLTSELDKRALENQNQALDEANKSLADAVDSLSQ